MESVKMASIDLTASATKVIGEPAAIRRLSAKKVECGVGREY